jgi:hypothetical protein
VARSFSSPPRLVRNTLTHEELTPGWRRRLHGPRAKRQVICVVYVIMVPVQRLGDLGGDASSGRWSCGQRYARLRRTPPSKDSPLRSEIHVVIAMTLNQQSYSSSSEVRARLKITVTVQRPDLARTFLQVFDIQKWLPCRAHHLFNSLDAWQRG